LHGHAKCDANPRSAGNAGLPVCERYSCRFQDRSVCEGAIDPNVTVPLCSTPVIADCSRSEYYAVPCAKEQQKHVFSTNDVNCRLELFSCWDTKEDRWYKGAVVPPSNRDGHTNVTLDNPVCLSTAMQNCGDLVGYGIDDTQFHCSEHYADSDTFKYYDWIHDKNWCEGSIDPSATKDLPIARPEEDDFNDGKEKGIENNTVGRPTLERSSVDSTFEPTGFSSFGTDTFEPTPVFSFSSSVTDTVEPTPECSL
jgi:hypothetical protein